VTGFEFGRFGIQIHSGVALAYDMPYSRRSSMESGVANHGFTKLNLAGLLLIQALWYNGILSDKAI
jgi:hypothetical protein